MKVVALVAVRSGSERVENKNIRSFAGDTILGIKLKQLKRISNIDEIYVNSNDDNMLNIAREHHCIGVKRDNYFASNHVPMREVYEHMAKNTDGDIIVYANATNPLVQDKTIYNCVDDYKKQSVYDSLNTAHPIKEFLYLENKSVNFQIENFPRSQDLPNIVALNFAVSIISRDNMIKYKHIIGQNPLIKNIDTIEGTDIDDMIDFEFSEFLYLKNNNLRE